MKVQDICKLIEDFAQWVTASPPQSRAVAAVATARARRRFTAVLLLGAVGYGIAVLFVLPTRSPAAATVSGAVVVSLGLARSPPFQPYSRFIP